MRAWGGYYTAAEIADVLHVDTQRVRAAIAATGDVQAAIDRIQQRRGRGMAKLTDKEKQAAEELAMALCGELAEADRNQAEADQEPAEADRKPDARRALLAAYNRAIAALAEIVENIADKPELCKKLIGAECELRADRCVTFEELVNWEKIANG